MKQVSFWLVLLIIGVLALSSYQSSKNSKDKLGETDFVAQLEAENIKEPVVYKNLSLNEVKVTAPLINEVGGRKQIEFRTKEFKEEWKEKLNSQGVFFDMVESSNMLTSILMNVLPLLLILGIFWFFMFRQMQGGSNKAMSFGKSRARLSSGDQVNTFKDVAGVDEAKEELSEIIDFLKDPKKFTRLGGKIPRGVLLVGPPGSGKTLLAKAVAGEASVPFYSISGSDFVEMFVGVGASRVRDLFQQGRKNAPCIIFIDEIDAVGRQRGAGMGGGHDEREQTLNQLLVEMDGFNTNDGVILMAATNRPDVLDRALLRPGRFDRQITVPNPDIRGREAILDIHLSNQEVPIADDVEVKVMARSTPGFSGADLANLINEAALLAARRAQDLVFMHDFEDAKDRVLMGPARRSMVFSPKEKYNTAIHEAGHAIVGRLYPGADPVHKATVIPRGRALGVTSFLPKEDRLSASKTYCLANIRLTMGGRAAEEIVFEEYTNGCANDLQQATKLAHSMVCEWGMSDLGPIAFGGNDEVFLGRDFTKTREFSEETAAAVDREVHRLLEEGYKDAKALLVKFKDALVAMGEELCERETLDLQEIDAIIRAHGGADLLPAQEVIEEEAVEEAAEETVDEVPDKDGRKNDVPDLPPGDIVPDTA